MVSSEDTSLGKHEERSGSNGRVAEATPRSIGRRALFTQGLVLGASVVGLHLLDGRLPVAEAAVAPRIPCWEEREIARWEMSERAIGTTRLQTCALGTDGRIYHTIRYPGGSWQPAFGNVNAQESNGGTLRFTDIDCGGALDSLHVTAVTRDGTIWHTIRLANGSWQPFFGNVNNQESNGKMLRFSDVSCAGTTSSKLHVAALTSMGTIWHTIRMANGSWQPTFGNVNNQESNGRLLHFTDVDCATVGENLHVCAINRNGTIWHTIRFANGSWQSSFGNVNNQESNGRLLRFTSVGCAAIDRNLHVTATDEKGVLWHTIRFANGSWQSSFGNVNNQQSNGGSLRFSDVDCANVAGDLQVGAVGLNKALWHTIRFANGSWQGATGNVNAQESNGGTLNFTSVGTAGTV
ncbi:hypothetical protein [Dictyobacter aurantiacus]|uniref:Uncharacterized protein n=1 Tax=Dictyobacter aurantiacus TaxID=1936993 RepID=A0A401ZIR2_9CHLR|nr:hypothetical protein [Dictyobacter aurantiacus]GCE06746.1 hypothetical protein KDAU_40750 [Dictyobacter aurantiacus]